jgi:hypothetical protein
VGFSGDDAITLDGGHVVRFAEAHFAVLAELLHAPSRLTA